MSFTPQVLLSIAAREHCVATINGLPKLVKPQEGTVKVTAAVLVPLCIDTGKVCLLYTLRSTNLKSHSGQVSFPGGKIDKNETAYEAALRETQEEIGIDPKDIDIWGEMPLVQATSDGSTIITPVVGFIRNFDKNKLNINPYEVQEVFAVPISDLCNIDAQGHYNFMNIAIPVYIFESYKIWGVTGAMTHSFLECFLHENVYTYNFLRNEYTFDELMPSKL